MLKMARPIRYALSALLVVTGAAKLIWPASNPSMPQQVYVAAAILELLLGLGLLVRPTRDPCASLAAVFFFGVVGYSSGQVLSSGLGVLRERCGCLGEQIEPSRGIMLIVAAMGLAMASALIVSPTRRDVGVR